MGIGFLNTDEDEEEEVYIPRSYVVCPICKDEIRSDEFPQKNEEKKCKKLVTFIALLKRIHVKLNQNIARFGILINVINLKEQLI